MNKKILFFLLFPAAQFDKFFDSDMERGKQARNSIQIM